MTERIIDKVLYFENGQMASDSLLDEGSVVKALKVRTPEIEVTDSAYLNPHLLTKLGLSLTNSTGGDAQLLSHQILKNLIILLSNTQLFPVPTVADAGKILHVASDGTLSWQSPVINIDGGTPSTPCIYNIDGGSP